MSRVFLREQTFFHETWTWEQCVLSKIDVLVIKYGYESSDFFVKNQKKRASYGLLWPIKYFGFERIDVFWQNIGMRVWGVYDKLKKKTWEHCVFKRVDVFLTKRGDESYFFLENERFLTKYGHKSSNFFCEK